MTGTAPAQRTTFGKGAVLITAWKSGIAGSGFDFEGVYTKVIPYVLIEYVLADGRKIKVSFSSSKEGIIITETFDADNVYSEEKQRDDWQAILNNFRKYVESLKELPPALHVTGLFLNSLSITDTDATSSTDLYCFLFT